MGESYTSLSSDWQYFGRHSVTIKIIPDQTILGLLDPMNRQSATKWRVWQLQLLHFSPSQQDSGTNIYGLLTIIFLIINIVIYFKLQLMYMNKESPSGSVN